MWASATCIMVGSPITAERRARQVVAEAANCVEAAGAGRLLVIAQQDMDRLFQRRGDEFRRHGEAERVEALHVAGSPAIKPVAVAAQHEGRRGPFLAGDRHHVGMAGQDHAAVDRRAESGEQRGLVALGVGNADDARAEPQQVILDEIDQFEIAARGFGVEGDQPAEQRDGPFERGIGGVKGHADRSSPAGSGGCARTDQFRMRRSIGLSREKAGISTSKARPLASTMR